MRGRIRRLWRQPLLHFALLGLGVQLAVAVGPGARSGRPIALDPGQRGALLSQQALHWDRTEAPALLRARTRQALREEILFREALRNDLDQLMVVRRRLRHLASFLQLAQPGTEAAEHEGRAREQGLLTSDPVLHQYLASAMREKIRHALVIDEPTDDELRASMESLATGSALPRRVRLSHVFVAGHGARSRHRIRQLAQRSEREPADPDALLPLGDAFAGGLNLPLWPRTRVAAVLGEALADAADALPVGRWSPPVESPYGQHLLFVREARPAGSPDPLQLREQARRRLRAQRERRLFEAVMRDLERRYGIEDAIDSA